MSRFLNSSIGSLPRDFGAAASASGFSDAATVSATSFFSSSATWPTSTTSAGFSASTGTCSSRTGFVSVAGVSSSIFAVSRAGSERSTKGSSLVSSSFFSCNY